MKFVDNLINVAPEALQENIETALLVLAEKLFEVEKATGEMGTDARIVWLTSQTIRIDSAKSLRSTLQHVGRVSSWLDTWESDVPKKGRPDEAWSEFYGLQHGAQLAAKEAVKALHALVDHVREKMPRTPAVAA